MDHNPASRAIHNRGSMGSMVSYESRQRIDHPINPSVPWFLSLIYPLPMSVSIDNLPLVSVTRAFLHPTSVMIKASTGNV
jgi:hypothetical protein